MKKGRIAVIVLVLILSFSLFVTQESEGAPKEISKEEKRLLGIEEQITSEKEKLKRAEVEEKRLLGRLNSLNKQIYETEEKISMHNRELSKIKKEIQGLERELKGLNEYLADYQERLADRLRVIYRARHLGYLEAILTSSNFAALLRRTYFMRFIATQDADLIQRVKEGIRAVEARQSELRSKEEELERLKRVEEAARRLRRSQHEDRKRLLARVRETKLIYASRIKELERASLRIERLIARLQKDIPKKDIPSGLSPELLRLKRRLPWPVDGGKILRGFGPYHHPRFGTQATSKGIGIGVPYGRVVRSVLEGKVVYADYLKGYGRLAMVDHGSGFYSIYAHLAALSVENGQMIKQGDLIGKVGDSESIGESGLHFELRINGKPVDPLEWLKRE